MKSSALEETINKFAEIDIQKGDIVKAGEALLKLIKSNPNNSRALNNLGIIAWMENDCDTAIEFFTRSCELDNCNTDAAQNLKNASIVLGIYDTVSSLIAKCGMADEHIDQSLCIDSSIQKLMWKTFIHDSLAKTIIRDAQWEPHIGNFIKTLPASSVMIDVGANFGYHSITSSKHLKKVYAYEPQPQVFELLKCNILTNKITNVEVFKNGVGETTKQLKIPKLDLTRELNAGDTSLTSNGAYNVTCIPLDSRLFERVDIIKLDVQGYELFALQGMVNLLAQQKPYLIVEIEGFQLQKFQYNEELLFRYIREVLNYEIYYLEFDYPADHLCVHKDNVVEFENSYATVISAHTVNNVLNHNVTFGVTKKVTMI